MGSDKKRNNEILIIGGGITGLAAAYLAAKDGRKVTIIEASNAIGGLLRTFNIGNSCLEYYYHHFFAHDAELNWLIKDLNIEDKLFFRKTSMGVLRDGKIYDFNTPLDLLKFKPINFIDKIRFGLTSLYLGNIANWQNFENISSMEWLKKRAGASTTSALWMPMLNIKFGPYASKVPLSWMIGRLRQRMNSRKEGDELLGYLDGSFKVLLDAIIEKFQKMDVELIVDAQVEKINFHDKKVKSVLTPKGEFSADMYLFTIPGIYLSKLLRKEVPILAHTLDDIKYFGAVCVILELNRPLSKIYWLNIADNGFPFGGIIEQTNFIDKDKYNGSYIAYLSRYFAWEEKIASLNVEQIKKLMLEHLPRIYKGFSLKWLKNIYVFKTNTAATVCHLDFSKYVPNCKTEISNLYIVNMSHVYPDERSTNNSIRIAAEACRLMGVNTEYVPKNNSLSGKIGF